MRITGKKKVTFTRIAARLGFSIVTVSHVLHNRPGVSDPVRLRILQAAKDMGYEDLAERKKNASALAKGRNTASSPTIYDIAARLGLSAGTVSRALNGSPRLKGKTAEKIIATAKDMGFILNSAAAHLVAGHHHKEPVATTTIYTLAEALQLSASTVSRALSDHPRTAEDTRQKVLSKAIELNYSPNADAVRLRTPEVLAVGLLVPKISHPVIREIIAALEVPLLGKGIRLITATFDTTTVLAVQRSLDILEQLTNCTVIVPLTTFRKPVKLEHKKTLISLGSFAITNTTQDVRADQYQAVYQATKVLLDKGCKSILFIDVDAGVSNFIQRESAFRQAHVDSGRKPKKRLVLSKQRFFFEHINWGNVARRSPGTDGMILIGYLPSRQDLYALDMCGLNKSNIVLIELETGLLYHTEPLSYSQFFCPYDQLGEWCAKLLLNKMINHVDFPANPVELPISDFQPGTSVGRFDYGERNI
jgi:DNA-binding LacI/PurR family transcriptional regulator